MSIQTENGNSSFQKLGSEEKKRNRVVAGEGGGSRKGPKSGVWEQSGGGGGAQAGCKPRPRRGGVKRASVQPGILVSTGLLQSF